MHNLPTFSFVSNIYIIYLSMIEKYFELGSASGSIVGPKNQHFV